MNWEGFGTHTVIQKKKPVDPGKLSMTHHPGMEEEKGERGKKNNTEYPN